MEYHFWKQTNKKPPRQCSVNIQTQKPDYSDNDDHSTLQYVLLAEKAHLLSSSDDGG